MSTGLLVLDEPSRPSRASMLAWACALVVYAGLVGVATARAGSRWPPLPGVALAHSLSMAVVTGLASVLLYAQAVRGGRRGYLGLAGTFSSVAVLLAGVVLVFPGALLPAGPDGAARVLLGGVQSATTLSYAWRLVLVVGVTLSAVLLGRDARRGRRPGLRHGVWPAVTAGTVPALLAVVWVAGAPSELPLLGPGGSPAPLAESLDVVLLLLGVVGVVATVAATRGESLIGRWLVAVSVVFLGDAVVGLHAERYSVGWYFTRAFSLLTMAALLALLVLSTAKIDRTTRAVAMHDTLTGAVSRAAFDTTVRRELAGVVSGGKRLALLWIDLDRFKAVNDRWGHAAGDELLVEVTRRIGHEVRISDVVARMGGDEFAALLLGPQSLEVAGLVADRVRESLRRPFTVSGGMVRISASVGITHSPGQGTDLDALLHQADVAMYAVKARGGDGVRVYDESLEGGLAVRLGARASLDRAISEHVVAIDAQDLVDPVSGVVHDVEVLPRWVLDGRQLAVGDLEAAAESAGMLDALACEELDAIAACLPGLVASLTDDDRVLVHLSGSALTAPGVAERLRAPRLARHARRLVLGVSERTTVEPAPALLEALDGLRALGYAVAVERIGSGVLSIEGLAILRPALLVTDPALVLRAAEGDAVARRELRATVRLARALGARALVAGVEGPAEAAEARSVDADLASGSHLAPLRPLTPEAGSRLLER